MIKLLSCVWTLYILSACSTLPSNGPKVEIYKDKLAEFPIAFIELSPHSIYKQDEIIPLNNTWNQLVGSVKANSLLASGDTILLNIWDINEGSLFVEQGMTSSRIDLVVDELGYVDIPYIGNLFVSGMSQSEFVKSLKISLSKLSPNIHVQIASKTLHSANITVLGEVSKAGQFVIPSNGLTLLTSIALAGGVLGHSTDITLSLNRLGNSYQIPYKKLITNPSLNLYLQDGDIVISSIQSRNFTVLGSVNKQTRIKIEEEKINLIDALAQAGGLDQENASAEHVFLFRFENIDRVNKLTESKPLKFRKGYPVIYHLDLSKEQSLFLASSFTVNNDDIIYVSRAKASEFRNFVQNILAPILLIDDAAEILTGN
jgi:polysaccharide export outer membrane protein